MKSEHDKLASETQPILILRNIVAGYKTSNTSLKSLFKKTIVVLNGIDFEVFPGERVAVVGGSGSGKTTLLRVILGLLKPLHGEVVVFGVPIYRIPWRKRVEVTRKIGYVPQDPYKSLNPILKVKKILAEPLEACGIREEISEKAIEEVLDLVKLPKSVLDMTPGDLSGGMRQRVLIARALVGRPRLLLLDEPTSALDVSIQAQIVNLLNEIYSKLNIAMVTVTHDLSVAQYLADRVVVLREGKVVEEGPFWTVITSPKTDYVKKLVSSYMRLTENDQQDLAREGFNSP